ncbi:hypothetical protein M0804_010695 [Polistes exclamans]|nr:hypothetical protein M0804_010695 [Polistes exclamans]
MDASTRQLTVTRSPSCMIMIQAQPCAAVDILLQPSSPVQNPVLDGDHSYERLENSIEGNQMGNTKRTEAKQSKAKQSKDFPGLAESHADHARCLIVRRSNLLG